MNRWESNRWGDQQQPALGKSDETEGGRWVKRDINVHRCAKPAYNSTIKRGDVWQCNTCYTQWRVTGTNSGSQWDPAPTTIVWEKVSRDDTSGMYAPGTK